MKPILLVAGLGLAGCAVQLLPEAERLEVTTDAARVANCKLLAQVEAKPPYYTNNDAINKLKNATAAAGANVLLDRRSFHNHVGGAYRCPR